MSNPSRHEQQTYTLRPGDSLIVDDEQWTYEELIDQLSLWRSPWSAAVLRGTRHGLVQRARVIMATLPRGPRGRELDALAREYGISVRTLYRYLEAPEQTLRARQQHRDYNREYRARRREAA